MTEQEFALRAQDQRGRLYRTAFLYLGGEHAAVDAVDEAVYRSEKRTGNKNRAMAFLLESCGLLHDDPEEVLDCYFRACSIRVESISSSCQSWLSSCSPERW